MYSSRAHLSLAAGFRHSWVTTIWWWRSDRHYYHWATYETLLKKPKRESRISHETASVFQLEHSISAFFETPDDSYVTQGSVSSSSVRSIEVEDLWTCRRSTTYTRKTCLHTCPGVLALLGLLGSRVWCGWLVGCGAWSRHAHTHVYTRWLYTLTCTCTGTCWLCGPCNQKPCHPTASLWLRTEELGCTACL